MDGKIRLIGQLQAVFVGQGAQGAVGHHLGKDLIDGVPYVGPLPEGHPVVLHGQLVHDLQAGIVGASPIMAFARVISRTAASQVPAATSMRQSVWTLLPT